MGGREHVYACLLINFLIRADVNISGPDPIRPVREFSDLGFDDALMAEIAKQNYTEPTQIQKQALPVALSGRDIIGIAQTGTSTLHHSSILSSSQICANFYVFVRGVLILASSHAYCR